MVSDPIMQDPMIHFPIIPAFQLGRSPNLNILILYQKFGECTKKDT